MPQQQTPKGQRLRLEWIDPATLGENPRNWRRHPAEQLAAIDEVLGDVGWAGVLLFNSRTGHLIDGHARRTAWMKKHPGQPAPVLVGDWSEADEKKILLTLDPLAAMAVPDELKLQSLISEVELKPGALDDLLDDLRLEVPAGGSAGSGEAAGKKSDGRDLIADQRGANVKIVVTVPDLAIVEKALVLTGNMNRGKALVQICREWQKRQLDVPAKDRAAA
jgi:hypothetical protein